MKSHNRAAEMLVPDGVSDAEALARTTHLGIGAHQDDLEILAAPGILHCFGRSDAWFTGVTCTDGSGSPRAGLYADCTDEAMAAIRVEEQRTAARIGRYSAILQLGYTSRRIKDPADRHIEDELFDVLQAARPRVVYTHNPADKHPTHTAVAIAAVHALRRLPEEERPAEVYGCEVWRDLDWAPDAAKRPLDASGNDSLLAALVGVYHSQIAGGKRYDLAAAGRRRANATFFASHWVDTAEGVVFALDLAPAVRDPGISLLDLVDGLIDGFRSEVRAQLEPLLAPSAGAKKRL